MCNPATLSTLAQYEQRQQMQIRFGYRSMLLAITTVLVYTASINAGITPSFSLRGCAWRATHVVLVKKGEKVDAECIVLESWKGNLKPGDKVTIYLGIEQSAERQISEHSLGNSRSVIHQ